MAQFLNSLAVSENTALGGSSSTVNGVTSRLLVVPSANGDTMNAITVKVPSATWGKEGVVPYGTGQVFELLKEGSGTVEPNDLVLLRVTETGSLGMAGNLHLATGVRQDTGYASNYAMKIEPTIDTSHILMVMPTSQTVNPLVLFDSAGVLKTKITKAGNLVAGMTGVVGSEKGLHLGDIGIANNFGISHSDFATSSGFALMQSNVGLTVVNTAANTALTFGQGGAAIGRFNASKVFEAWYGSVLTPGAATTIPLVTKGAASQTADLQQWQNSASTVLAGINASGNLRIPRIHAGTITGSGLVVGDAATYSWADYFGVAHSGRANGTDYALIQNGDGFTILNSALGQSLDFRLGNNTNLMTLSSTGLTIGKDLTTKGILTAVATKTADYTAAAEDRVLLIDASVAARTITLPAAAAHTGREYIIKKIDTSANKVTVDPNAAELIDGAPTYTLTAPYESVTITSNGTAWYIL